MRSGARFTRFRGAVLSIATLALGAASLSPRLGHAVIVERVVAVVGERPILLSDLKARARPFLVQIAQNSPSAAQRAAAESQTLKEVLQRMVDERLEESAADKAKIQVTADEVDAAVANVAGQAKITSQALLQEVARRGLTEQDYRDELKRQLLEGKLVQLRLRGRVRITEEDAQAAYQRYLRELGSEAPVDLRLLALRINPAGGPREVEVRQALGQEIVDKARGGGDFCKLIAQYSDDDETKANCGSRGPQPMANLVPELQQVVRSLKPGEVAGPIRFGNEAVVILQLLGRSPPPPYETVREAMYAKATNDALDRQKKAWLAELRRSAYVDVRY